MAYRVVGDEGLCYFAYYRTLPSFPLTKRRVPAEAPAARWEAVALQSLGEALELLRPAEEWLNTDEDLTRFTFPLGSMTVLMTAEKTDVCVLLLVL